MGFVDKASTTHRLSGGKKYPWKSLFLFASCALFLLTGGREAFAEDSSQDLTPPSAFEKDENHDLVPDLLPLEPAYLPWGPNTSGPFFTGTAEVEPVGSFFLEPYWFDYLQPGIGFSSLSMPERLSVGLI